MNLNALRKNYDKLTAKERFAAIVAADRRGDNQECDALMQSAPKKTFAVKHHYGLSIAFERLSMFHHIRQLANAGILLMSGLVEKPAAPETLFKDVCTIAERYQTNAAAWDALCNEYGIDPQALLDLPGEGVLRMAGRLAGLLQDDQPLPELQANLADLRETLESMAGQWE